VDADEGLRRLEALGFRPVDARTLWRHFDEAESRGKTSHGHSRIAWLEAQRFSTAPPRPGQPDGEGRERWNGEGTVGYLVLDAVVESILARPPEGARLVVCERTFPTGMLGHYARRLAEAGLTSVVTATSPARLGPPDGPKVTGTNPLAIGVPSSDEKPVVVDVSPSAVTWGDVLAGVASADELVPFGGDQWHKAFAIALGLQLLVDSLVGEEGFGAVLLAAPAKADPVPALRALELRLPGG
jgi:LDH2 family malate/lactate/ureidoglycolate dehydrogenase